MSRYLAVGLLLLLAAGTFAGCRKHTPREGAQTVPAGTLGQETSAQTLPCAVDPQGQLMASAQTQEEAQSIADLYGITLVDWGYGVARFYTDEDPQLVIRRGQENGWPELCLNRTVRAFEK